MLSVTLNRILETPRRGSNDTVALGGALFSVHGTTFQVIHISPEKSIQITTQRVTQVSHPLGDEEFRWLH